MKPMITYSNYMLAKKEMNVNEFAELLDDGAMKNIAGLFGSDSISKNQLVRLLTGVSDISNVVYDNISEEPSLFSDLVQKYIDDCKIDRQDIGYIIYTRATQIPRSRTNIPYFIQNKFGFDKAEVFSIDQKCSSSLVAVNIASLILHKHKKGKILILSSNFFPTPESRVMGLYTGSDAVGIIEITYSNQGFEFIDYKSVTDGTIVHHIDLAKKAELVVRVGSAVMKQTLKDNNLTFDDIRTIIAHNTNLSGWNSYFNILNINSEKLYKKNFGGVGHLGDVDFVRNLTDIYWDAEFENSFIMAYALGRGTSFNVLLLHLRKNCLCCSGD